MKRRAWFAQLKPLLWLTIVTSALLIIEHSTYTLDIVVMSADDSGAGTLRQAIEDLNSGGSGTEPNSITFAPNVKTISLITPLPFINNSVTIDGFRAGINCSQLSPVTDPEQFSNAIAVTIDGSKIPTTGSTLLVGLLICTDEVTVRGLRIANFTNTDDAQVAGIITNGASTLIECCEVININSNASNNSITAFGIQGNFDTIISKCFVHNLKSANRKAVTITTSTGGLFGITLFKTASNCRVENIQSGDIIHTASGINPLTLLSGLVIGITDSYASTFLCGAKQCECPTDCQGSECILVQNCIVNCCKTGSIFAIEDADVIIGTATGISLSNSNFTESVVDNCTVCNIYSGSAKLSEATFSLRNGSSLGIASSTNNTCLNNNNLSDIHRGAVELGGINSSAELLFSAGIIASSEGSVVIDNNTISSVTCQQVTASGICTQIEDTGSSVLPLPCIGNLINPFTLTTPISIGMLITSSTASLCNNTVTNIQAGKRIANGEQALILSGYTAGIIALINQVSAHNNRVKDIFGAELFAGPTTRGIFGGAGSRGIALWTIQGASSIITAKENVIEHVCEQTLRAASGIPGRYLFLSNLSNQTEVLLPAAQTIGLSIKIFEFMNLPNNATLDSSTITVENNTVKDVVGAVVRGGSPGVGTMAIGIAIEPFTTIEAGSNGTLDFSDPQQVCFDSKDSMELSTVQGNTIKNIWSGTKNTAYGILLDGTNTTIQSINQFNTPLPLLFTIENNIITNVTGLGVPHAFEATLISGPCGGSESDSSKINLIPFPYQPTTGIYTIFGNCSTISGNTITSITEPSKNARGITTQASNDIDINNNSISKVNGYGIFVGGAIAGVEFINSISGLFTEENFEAFFASARNTIFSNSTCNNTKQGIELGLIDWNNYFQISESQCEISDLLLRTHQEIPEDSVAVYGNHGQIKPRILAAKCRRDGTITIDYLLNSPDQPFTKFVIQFFTNSSNTVPHGEHHISEFDDPRFVFQTDVTGRGFGSITFTPLVKVNNGDIISAHVTVATIGQSTSVESKFKGDTSEFGVESDSNPCPTVIAARPSTHNQKPGFASILGR